MAQRQPGHRSPTTSPIRGQRLPGASRRVLAQSARPIRSIAPTPRANSPRARRRTTQRPQARAHRSPGTQSALPCRTTVARRRIRNLHVSAQSIEKKEHVTRRGGGGEEWGGDACVAPGEVEPTHQNQGEANIPTGQRERKNNLD